MDTLIQDIRYGVRMLLKSPSVSIVATIALALGIGANTAIFSVVNAVLLRPLPFPNSEALTSVYKSSKDGRVLRGSYSYPDFFDLRTQNNIFERVTCYHDSDFILTQRGEPVRLTGVVSTADLLPLLGVAPMLGRGFVPEEDKPSSSRVVVLSQSAFEKYFGADPNILNQPITIDGKPFTVVGVMPSGFQFPIQNDPIDLWTTIAGDATGKEPVTEQRGAHFLRVIGRLKPGVTERQAQADVDTIAKRLEQQYPDTNTRRGFYVEQTLRSMVADIRPALLILLGAVSFVLLIACANVANLLLARAMSRYKEMAIRSALGASRWRVIRQLLIESVLLSVVGGAIGLLLAVWWSDLLIALGKQNIPRAVQVGLDWRVLLYTLIVSVGTGVLFGLAPAFHSSSKTGLSESLKEGVRSASSGAAKNRLRASLVVSEVAVAVVLLVGAGLLIKSLWLLHTVNPGLDPTNILTFNIALPEVKYRSEQQSRFFGDLKTRLQSVPGVQSVSSVYPLPLSGDRFTISFQIDGRPVAPKDEPSGDVFVVDPGYFKTMGIAVRQGRDFNERDQHKSPQVVIVNETFARLHFPNEDIIGKRIKPGIGTFEDEDTPMREIVGVVGDVKNRALSTAPQAAYYLPQTQVPFSQMIMVVKTIGDPHGMVKPATKEVAAMDADLPVFGVKTMEEYISQSVSTPRFNTTLLSIFAAVALVLTVVGLYGVMSYAVAQRTNEIGIRMALGAQTRDVLALIIKQGFQLVLLGLAIGLLSAFALMKIISGLLFGVTTKDPFTFVAVTVVLTFIALLACYVPARRATRVDPLEALRYE